MESVLSSSLSKEAEELAECMQFLFGLAVANQFRRNAGAFQRYGQAFTNALPVEIEMRIYTTLSEEDDPYHYDNLQKCWAVLDQITSPEEK